MMHVCPPKVTPDFIRVSALANAAGWMNIDQATLRHKSHDTIWSRGEIMLAEFGHGEALKPSFPSFTSDGTKPPNRP